MRLPALALTVALAAGCARPARVPEPGEGPRPPLDSATVARLCSAPDSVLAGRAPCELRDQARPLAWRLRQP